MIPARCRLASFLTVLLSALLLTGVQAADSHSTDRPLPSWNEGPTRQALLDFVHRVSEPGGPDFVPPAERIAVFDNDGTLWAEQPMYFQLYFVLDRLQALAPEHPEWREREPFRSALAGDLSGVAVSGQQGLMQLLSATHAAVDTEAFAAEVEAWIETARHPQTGRRFRDMTYRPMLELLDYLRAHGFQTWIVSGGGQDFLRPWAEAAYGIPPQQVVGSQLELRYEVVDGVPRLLKLPEIALIDDKAGKPVGIQRFIGRRPILAFGNSDGDFEMLEWTTAGDGPRLAAILHHTDGEREFAYDRESHVGKLARGLDEGPERGWLIVDMARDWRAVFP
jgi:phosphoserine phosphatase